MRKISRTLGTIALAAALFMNPITSFGAAVDAPLPFKDISASPALGQILLLQHMGFVKGYVDQSFKPEQTISRAEFVAMLVAGKGYESEAVKLAAEKTAFNDVAGWETGYINFAVNQGWIQGTGGGRFEPDKLITNAQAVAILMNSIGLGQSQSTEAGKPWYANYYLADQNYHLGLVSSANKPGANATRSHVAELIVKLLADVPVDPSTGRFDTKQTTNNKAYSIRLYEDIAGSFSQASSEAARSGSLTLLNGQIIPLAGNAAVYGDPVPGSGIWYMMNESGLATFVYVVSEKQDSLNRSGQWSKLWSVYQALKYDYYTVVDEETLVNGAIDGMLKSLGDPYTVYMNPAAAASFNSGITSSFEGVGTTLKEQNGALVISGILPGSPAEKAGLRAGDTILQVNGKDVAGMSSDELAVLIRGPKGTVAEFIIQRPGMDGKLTVSVTRDTIIQKTVAGQMLSDSIGTISISRMSEPTTDEFHQLYAELKMQGMKGLILDLRQNPGGLMSSALLIANELVPNQKSLFQLEYRNGSRVVYVTQNDVEQPLPIVVLTDNGTASAAEILAAALSESADAILVGAVTYGKGVVQTTQGYSDGSSVKYTESKWLTPSGDWIHKKGIMPDYEVSLPGAPSTQDTQLQKAEEVLKQRLQGQQ